MKIKGLLAITALLCSSLFSCKKSTDISTSSSQTGTSFQLKVANTNVGVVQKITSNGSIQWASGFANPNLIKFEAKQNNTSIEFKSTNTVQIDLMASVATSFGNFTIPAGIYNEIEIKIQLNKNGSSPALQMKGTFTNNSTSIPVEFQVNDFLEIKSEKDSVAINDSNSFTAITTLDLSTFTTGITESMLLNASLTNGTLMISKDSNTDLYNIILNNLGNHQRSCEFEHHHH